MEKSLHNRKGLNRAWPTTQCSPMPIQARGHPAIPGHHCGNQPEPPATLSKDASANDRLRRTVAATFAHGFPCANHVCGPYPPRHRREGRVFLLLSLLTTIVGQLLPHSALRPTPFAAVPQVPFNGCLHVPQGPRQLELHHGPSRRHPDAMGWGLPCLGCWAISPVAAGPLDGPG
jgi:hypothetical protein